MGQSIFINFDSETLTSRCRGLDDLRTRKFSPFVAGDSIVFDLFLTGTTGLLNIQDYTTRIGVGNLNARPESGEYLVGGFTLDYNNSAADLEATIESATGNACSVIELSPFVFKVSFDAVGAQTIPAIDSSDLSPRSTVDRQTLQAGDATTKEIWLWRLYANPIAFTDVFTNIAGDGVQGTIALSTAGIYDLLGNNASVKTFFEIELTDSVGDIITVMQASIVLTGEVIGEGFSGYIPSPSMPAEATAFLESFPDPTIVGDLTVGGFDLPTGAADGYVLTSDASGSGTWAAAGGGAAWGDITGTLSNQSDLQSALDANASGVATNTSNIATNATAITTNAAGISSNTQLYNILLYLVDDNTLATQNNASDIQNIATVVTGLVSSGDNSAKIQAVINSVAANGGGDIVIPAGTWEIASTLVISTSNVRLRGAGGGWNHDVGGQGVQAATTLKWIGTEFDGAVVISGSLDAAGAPTAGVTKNGTRLGTANGFATSDVAKYQGMLIKHVSSGVYDLIMDSDNGYVEIKADSNAAWADSQSFKIYKPSVMVEVKSVYGDGTTDQQIVGSGVSQIHFDCQDANIGLRVIAASNGVYEDLSFIEPKTAAIYMGVKNIGTMDKPATVSQDPQFNSFKRIVSRNFAGGEYGGLFVCNGVVDWGSNTSFNNFDDMRALIRHGDGLIFGSSDANRFHNALVLREVSGVAGTGEALKFLGSNGSESNIPRDNRLTQFSASGGATIICYGTDTYVHESRDNGFPWLNTDNGTPLPTIETDASCFYNTDTGNEYFKKSAQLVVGDSAANMEAARDAMGTESLRIANGSNNHMVLEGIGATDWQMRVSGEDLLIAGTAGNAELKLGNRTSFSAGFAPKLSEYSTSKTLNWWNRTYLFRGLIADIDATLDTGSNILDGMEFVIKNGDPTYNVNVKSNGKLIDGATTGTTPITLTPKQWITVQWDGVEWWIIGRG